MPGWCKNELAVKCNHQATPLRITMPWSPLRSRRSRKPIGGAGQRAWTRSYISLLVSWLNPAANDPLAGGISMDA